MEEMYNNFYRAVGLTFNIHGQVVKRPCHLYPYSYDPFCIYKSDDWSPNDDLNYSDRLMQWDYDKFINCMIDVWGEKCGQNFDNKEPNDVEKFLSLYNENKIELTGIEQACNVATGYPYWIFYYKNAI